MPIEQELKDAAWHYANNVNVGPSSPNLQNYFTGVHNSFLAGAEWQFKQDEEIINGFFSREAVESIGLAYEGHIIASKLDQMEPVSFSAWLDTNYPPKTNES